MQRHLLMRSNRGHRTGLSHSGVCLGLPDKNAWEETCCHRFIQGQQGRHATSMWLRSPQVCQCFYGIRAVEDLNSTKGTQKAFVFRWNLLETTSIITSLSTHISRPTLQGNTGCSILLHTVRRNTTPQKGNICRSSRRMKQTTNHSCEILSKKVGVLFYHSGA